MIPHLIPDAFVVGLVFVGRLGILRQMSNLGKVLGNVKSGLGAICVLVLFLAGFSLIGLAFMGAAWISDKVLPTANLIAIIFLIVLLVVFLPLSFTKKFAATSGVAFVYWSYLCGLCLWMSALIVTLSLWGVMAAAIGLIMAGVGVVPISILAAIFKGRWEILWPLLTQLAMTFGARGFGFYLIAKASKSVDA